MTSDMKQINARITDAQWQVIQRLMVSQQLTLAELIRMALAEYATQHGADDRPFYDTPQHGGKRSKE